MYLPSPPMALASASMWVSPKPWTLVSSTFQSLFFWSGLSWVSTLMPASWARLNTGSSATASFGTTAITSTLRAIRSSTARTCCAASAWVGPIIEALTPSSLPSFWMPTSMALNHGMPPILTTVTISGGSAAKAPPARASASGAAAASPIRRRRVERMMVQSPCHGGSTSSVGCSADADARGRATEPRQTRLQGSRTWHMGGRLAHGRGPGEHGEPLPGRVRHLRHRLADGAQRRPEHLHPVVVVEAQQRDLVRDRHAGGGGGLERPQRENVVQREDRGRAADGAPGAPSPRRRSRRRSKPASISSARAPGTSATASSMPATRSRMLPIAVADATTSSRRWPSASRRCAPVARGGDIVHRDRVELAAVVERPIEDHERDAVALQGGAGGESAVARHRDHAGRPPGDQRLDLARLLGGIAAAGRDQQPPPGCARLALQPVDHLGEEGIAELGHDRADDGPLGAAQGRGGDVAPVAELVDDPAHARGQLRVDMAPAGQHVGHGGRRDGGRARHIVDRRPPPDAAPSSGDVYVVRPRASPKNDFTTLTPDASRDQAGRSPALRARQRAR